jgi:hypothetical protein
VNETIPRIENDTTNISDKLFTDVFIEHNAVLKSLGFPAMRQDVTVIADNILPADKKTSNWTGYADWKNLVINLHFNDRLRAVVQRKDMMGGNHWFALHSTKAIVTDAYSHETGHIVTEHPSQEFPRTLERHSVNRLQVREGHNTNILLARIAVSQMVRGIF